MDFANCYIGGGVLGHGCVQEEIRFMICPELLASMLFTERMSWNESVFIIGTARGISGQLLITVSPSGSERFSLYAGYASSFQWTAGFTDETSRFENHVPHFHKDCVSRFKRIRKFNPHPSSGYASCLTDPLLYRPQIASNVAHE